MKYNYLLLCLGVMSFFSVQSQTDSIKITLDEFEVTTTRVGEKSPVAHENISKEEIELNNHGVDLPITHTHTQTDTHRHTHTKKKPVASCRSNRVNIAFSWL